MAGAADDVDANDGLVDVLIIVNAGLGAAVVAEWWAAMTAAEWALTFAKPLALMLAACRVISLEETVRAVEVLTALEEAGLTELTVLVVTLVGVISCTLQALVVFEALAGREEVWTVSTTLEVLRVVERRFSVS